jgi:amino acid adenylation domain-containing protein
LPNGDVELLGRIDHQVKVRGFRIELGEIETVLARHPAVQQTVVVAREDAPGDKRLVAYVVPVPDQTPAASDLRQFMREKLPDYMLPSNFVTLETLPLTPNKKIDRRALPAPDDTRPDLEQTFVAPRTPVEELVTGIWSQVLGLKQIGVHDNFFELGGHSLLATQVISRLRQAFEVELPLRSLFEAPTVAGLVAGIEAVRGSAREMSVLPMEPVERGRPLPLSFAQQRLWFLDQLDPGNASYNVPVALRLTGQLQVRALAQSLDEIVRRHEALRTTFASVDGKPVQVIAPELKLAPPVVDLAGIAGARREAHVRRLAMQEGRLIFDLVRGPLVRATLLRLGHDEHVLLLTIHHIVCDAWSLGVLIQELTTLYDAFCTGKQSRRAGRKRSLLPELPIQYADFAVRQREWLQGGELEKQLVYWRRQLDALETLDLLTDHPRPPMQTFQGAIQVFKLPGDLTEALRTLSRQEGNTLFMTLLAAFDTLLYRYTGQTDVAVGSPIANRNRKEIEGLIGFFVNTLVMRTDLSENPTFRELLGRVREVALGAYAHQDVPFEMLVDELQPGRDLSRSPLFQVMFMLQNAPIPEKELDDLSIKAFSVGNETAMFDLSLSIWETGRELSGAFEYNTDLFDAATIARLVGHFQTLLESVVADAHARLSELSLLTAAERQQLLVEWSSTVIDGAPDRCVHELFVMQVESTPDAVAVIFPSTSSGRVPSTPDRLRSASGRVPSTGFAKHPGLDERAECDQCLTFRELDRRANQLAHYLRQMGVGPETPVGICVERSLEMVIGLLGILKAGGAYVPLDPAHPPERLAFMLRDTQSPVLVTASPLLPLISNLQSPIPQVVCLDVDWEDIARASEENPPGEVKSENLAYVIYTSGSTGEPKGVTVQHGSLADYARTASAEYALESDDRVLQFASISFDASAEEIYASLIRGATLVLRTESMIDTLETFGQKCHDWDITVLYLPTAYWHTMASGLGQGELALPPTVRLVTIGGERAIPERLVTWQQHIDRQIRLVNSYGPTETTIVATMCELSGRVEAGVALREVPIGRAVRNAQTFVLDRHLQPVPVGIPGELYIGGGGLARGYLDRPGLTAERFVPSLFPPRGGDRGGESRLYKTGDLVRYLADGSLEFLGRTDQQVKVRGFRIELGEIEAVLGKHPAVQETVLLTHDSDSGDKQLVAYVVAQPEQQLPNVSELRQFVEQKLPNYMTPSAFVTLETLPLTLSGKIDRRALPAPTGVRPELEKTYVAPSTPYEEILVEVWEEVLGVEKIGVHDNFFDLGGHSLLATQVVSRVRDRFEIDLPVRTLFEASTIAEMAPRIEQTLIAGNVAPKKTAPQTIGRKPQGEPAPLSFAQRRLWFLDQWEPGSPAYNIPMALRLAGPLDVAALCSALEEIVRRHQVLQMTCATIDEEPVLMRHPDPALAVKVVDTSALAIDVRKAEVQRLTGEEARRSFDLARDLPIRASLLRQSATEHVLLLTMHHIVSDGWSTGILIHELAALYQAFSTGKQSPLPDLPIQYADFAVWQREWLRGEVLEAQLDYWQERLAGDFPVLELPADRPRPPVFSFRGATQMFQLGPDLTEALRALSQREGATLFMTLLAAFKTLLYRYTGQEDVAVGSPIANRNHSQIEGLIGFFVNTLVLRSDLSGNPTFRQLLARVREVTLGAYAHQDLPFEMLVEKLQPERDMSRTPLFQVAFALQNAPLSPLELPGLTMSPLQIDSGMAKFDLTLSMVETRRGLMGEVEYSSDLFDEKTIARLTIHYQNLLQDIVSTEASPDRRLSELALLTADEQRRLVVEWNDTYDDLATKRCVHELFEMQAARRPDALALSDIDAHLTYAELNRRANGLARHLQALGVGPETRVCICLERSPEVGVAILGVLKAGGAYVPLDPAYPGERLAFILQDTQASVLLTQQHLLERLPSPLLYTSYSLLLPDTDWPAITKENETNPASNVTAGNLAYVIYTSGSTGRPKGVPIAHRSLLNLVGWHQSTFAILPADRATQVAGLGFDASVWEMWPYLAAGASVHFPDEETRVVPERLCDWLVAQGITVSFLPTPLAEAVLSLDWPEGLALRTLLTGGDKLHHYPPACLPFQLVNNYGPTESTVVATSGGVPSWDGTQTPPPIGRPIRNTQVYLLDRHLNPVPAGVPGELHIGGDSLARGYLGRPELTAERFVPSPFSPPGEGNGVGGRRLYKTGDLGRYRPDGNIEFLGRLDHQVKLRGFRIELGEIEAVLRQHPQVQESVTLVREDQPGGKRLVAYVVGIEPTPTATELRHFLHKRLPEYMIPSAFVTLGALPLTSNGKVDRRALPAPEGAGLDLDQTPVAPRDALELRLVRIWEQVLGVRPVGVTHSFFDLGGHSLLAVRLLARIRQGLGQELPLAVLFSSPSVERLAALLRQHGASRLLFAALVPLQAGQPDRRPLFLVHPGGGNVFCYADLVRHLGVEQPCYGLQARGLDEEQVPHTGVETMASYYLEWVRAVQAEGPYQLGGWSAGGVIAFEMAQQLQAQGQEVALLALIDSHAPAGAEPEPDDLKLLGGFALDLGLPLQRLRLDSDHLATLGADERLTWILQEAQRVQVIPGDVELPQVRRLFHVFKYNVQAVRQYVPRAYAGPVVLFKAQEQRGDFEPDLGWRAVTAGELAVQTVPGDHYTLVREPHVAALAEQLAHRLLAKDTGLVQG